MAHGTWPKEAFLSWLENQESVVSQQCANYGMVHLLGGLLANFPVGFGKGYGNRFEMPGSFQCWETQGAVIAWAHPGACGSHCCIEEPASKLPNLGFVRNTYMPSEHFLFMKEPSLRSNKKPNIPGTCFLRNYGCLSKYVEGVGAISGGDGVSLGVIIWLEMCSFGRVQCGLE